MDRSRSVWPWSTSYSKGILTPLRGSNALPEGQQAAKNHVTGALREKLVKYRHYLELKAAERSVGDPYLQAFSLVAPKRATPVKALPAPPASPLPRRAAPRRVFAKREKQTTPGSAKTTRPSTRGSTPLLEDRPWTCGADPSRSKGSALHGKDLRPFSRESPLQEIGQCLELWSDALGSHFVRAANAQRWLEAMCGSGEIQSQTELCNVAQRLGLSEEDALRVAVALWALSDGKALSLRLLVGALEDDRDIQLLAPDSSLVPLPHQLLSDQLEQNDAREVDEVDVDGPQIQVDEGHRGLESSNVVDQSEVSAQSNAGSAEQTEMLETPAEEDPPERPESRGSRGDEGRSDVDHDPEDETADEVQESLVRQLVLRAQQQGRQAAETRLLAREVVFQAQQRGREVAEASLEGELLEDQADHDQKRDPRQKEDPEPFERNTIIGADALCADQSVIDEDSVELVKGIVLSAQSRGRRGAEARLLAKELVAQAQRHGRKVALEPLAKIIVHAANQKAMAVAIADAATANTVNTVNTESQAATPLPSTEVKSEHRDGSSLEVVEDSENLLRPGQLVKALHGYTAQDSDEMTFKRGAKMRIIRRDLFDEGWYLASEGGRQGLIPFNYVKAVSISPAPGAPGAFGAPAPALAPAPLLPEAASEASDQAKQSVQVEEKGKKIEVSAKATGKVSMRALFKMASRLSGPSTSSPAQAAPAAPAAPAEAPVHSTPQPKPLPGRVPLAALFKAKISRPRQTEGDA